MVAPNKIIELSPTTQIWISDVYCLYGNNWFWLRLLPYILRDELIAEGWRPSSSETRGCM
jgi:hypothetical protein